MKKILATTILASALITSTHTTATAATFTDVPSTHWAHEAIDSISKRGLINGYSDGTYKLNEPITRAQAAKIVALATNAKPSATFKPAFKDIKPTHGSYDHIRALTEKNIFTNSGTFNPNAPLTRAQMAKILTLSYRIIVDNNDLIAFNDVRKLNDNYGYITTLAELDITTTPAGGNYKPNDAVTRAQMAAFIQRATTFDTKREIGTITYDGIRRMYLDKSKPEPLPPVIDIPDNAITTVTLVNEHRKKAGAKQLAHDLDLSAIAKTKAQDMATNNYFSHTSPTYGNTGQLLNQFKYKWSAYGENIAKGQSTPQQVVRDWMNSPGHKANILDTNFHNIGVGFATDTKGTTYWVQIFSKK